jgi:NAD(P)-dependent dehydrogenase (short-subunit alcohol dehydrogenase family)
MAAKQPPEGAICARYQALKRIGQPEDVVDVVVFLASDGARWINGMMIDADAEPRALRQRRPRVPNPSK